MARISRKQKRIIEILVLVAAAAVSLLLWDTFLIFPVKLFTVLIHEMSHGLTAIFSGGSVVSLDFGFDLSGRCVTTGGSPVLIASAGYLGSFIFGALLFYSAYDRKNGIWITSITATIMILFSVNFIGNTTLAFIALVYPAVLIISPRYFHPTLNSYLLKIFGMVSCIYVLFDIRSDIFSSSVNQSDAQALADITSVPAAVWGGLWLVVSAVSIIFLFRYAYRKGMD